MKISKEYAAIVALSIRQTLAAFEITVPAGTLDTTDAKSFMKGALLNRNTGTSQFMIYSIRNLQQRGTRRCQVRRDMGLTDTRT